MGDDFATLTLTRRTWTAVFVSQLYFLYSLVVERDQEEVGNDTWNAHNQTLRDAIDTFMPVLKEASMVDPALDKEWFEFKLAAGMFPKDSLVDNAKEIVQITAAD